MSSLTFETQFPPEIYETIIDYLAAENDDLHSLKACSLVCHDFLPLARNHLFGTIKLNITPFDGPDPLVRLLLSTPQIGKHVHTLYYHVRSKDRRAKKLPLALKLLTKLRSLNVCQARDECISFNFKDLSPSLKNSILFLLRLPTLSRLSLGPIDNFNMSDLNYCTSLKYLNIYNVRFAPVDLEMEKYYSIYGSYKDTNHLFSADGVLLMDFKHYSYMKSSLNKAFQNKIEMLFKQCSQLMDIRTYKIDYGDSILINRFANMILPSLQTLQHLHIHITTSGLDNLLADLLAEFKAIAGHNIVDSISISVVVIHDDDDSLILGNWAALDWALAHRNSGWANLKNVSLTVEILCYCPASGKELAEAVRRLPETQLKGLVQSDDIKFDFKVTTSGYIS